MLPDGHWTGPNGRTPDKTDTLLRESVLSVRVCPTQTFHRTFVPDISFFAFVRFVRFRCEPHVSAPNIDQFHLYELEMHPDKRFLRRVRFVVRASFFEPLAPVGNQSYLCTGRKVRVGRRLQP